MKKYKFGKKLKEAVLKGRINEAASILIDGKEKKAWCHAWGMISNAGNGLPCLVLENDNGSPRYTVVAVSLQNRGTAGKWICIQPVFLEKAVGYFLENQQMKDIADGGNQVSRLPATDKGRPDFQMGDACIEVLILRRNLNAISDCNRWSLYSAIRQDEKYYKQFTAIQETGERVILLLVNQYGKEGEKQILSNNKTNEILDRAIQDGVEVWVANLQVNAEGISLQDYQNVKSMISNR